MSYHRVSIPSLETRWLPNSFLKGLPPVEVVTATAFRFGGMYVSTYFGAWHYDGHVFDAQRRPVVVVNEHDDCAATLAHEMRHHWQRDRGTEPFGDWSIFDDPDERRRMVRYYSDPCEFDALQFEITLGLLPPWKWQWVCWLEEAGFVLHYPRTIYTEGPPIPGVEFIPLKHVDLCLTTDLSLYYPAARTAPRPHS